VDRVEFQGRALSDPCFEDSTERILHMQKLRVQNFGISLDGYSAGPDQSLDHPIGIGGMALGEWFFPTRTFRRMHNPDWTANVPDDLFGEQDGAAGIDDYFAARGFENVGALLMDGTCSAPSAEHGPMTTGRAGGATIRPFIAMCSY